METRLRALEEQVTRLTGRVEQLEEKLAALPPPAPAWPEGEPQLHLPPAGAEATRWVTLVGRSCIVLGGAFLIRALTEGGTLSGGVGVALGLAFAATWVFFAHRAGAKGATSSAGFHGVTAALIAYPLILEATTRMGAMSSLAAALALVAFTGLLLVVSWRDHLGWLAWIGVLSCVLTTLALLRVTGAGAEFTAVLLVVAAATFWLGERPRWGGLRWLPAVVLDLVVLRAVVTSTPPLLVYSVALAGASLALVLSRTAGPGRPVGAFEIFQTVAGLGIGLAGALRASAEAGQGSGAAAAAVLAASLLAAFVAAGIVPRRGNRDQDFLFYATLSLGLLSTAVSLLTSGELRGVLWSILALLTVLLGRRRQPGWFWSVSVLLAFGAVFSTGLGRGVDQVSPASVAVLVLVIVSYVLTVRPLPAGAAPSTVPSWASPRLPAAALLLLASAEAATLLLRALRPFSTDPARLATATTLVAIAIAFVLALLRRRMPCPELTWIANLALALAGVELVVRGLPSGRPLLLLVSFVLYGSALLLIPRLAPPRRDPLSPSRPH